MVDDRSSEMGRRSGVAACARANEDSAARARLDEHSDAVRCSRAGLRHGFVAGAPIALGVGGYGLAFGVLARDAGLSVAEATLLSATVLAGAAQFVAVDAWGDGLPVATILLATLVVNLRYVLFGATLARWLADRPPAELLAGAFLTADENWALTVAAFESGHRDAGLLLGSGLAIWSCWVVSTAVGASASAAVPESAAGALEFLLAAVFVTIAVDLFDGRADVLPWCVAAIVAAVAAEALPGYLHVLVGGLAGAGAGVIGSER